LFLDKRVAARAFAHKSKLGEHSMVTFRRGWLRRGIVFSDEGFSVWTWGRSHLAYRERGRRTILDGELGTNGWVIYSSAPMTWDDGTPVDAAQRITIVNNVKRALEWRGAVVQVE
jgi:hypothetical protein